MIRHVHRRWITATAPAGPPRRLLSWMMQAAMCGHTCHVEHGPPSTIAPHAMLPAPPPALRSARTRHTSAGFAWTRPARTSRCCTPASAPATRMPRASPGGSCSLRGPGAPLPPSQLLLRMGRQHGAEGLGCTQCPLHRTGLCTGVRVMSPPPPPPAQCCALPALRDSSHMGPPPTLPSLSRAQAGAVLRLLQQPPPLLEGCADAAGGHAHAGRDERQL